MGSNPPLGYEMDICHTIGRTSPPDVAQDFLPQSFQPTGLSSRLPSPPHPSTAAYPPVPPNHHASFQNAVPQDMVVTSANFTDSMVMLNSSQPMPQSDPPQFMNDFGPLPTDFTAQQPVSFQPDLLAMGTHSHSVTPPQHMNPPPIRAPTMVFDTTPPPIQPARSRSNTVNSIASNGMPVSAPAMSAILPQPPPGFAPPMLVGFESQQNLANAGLLLNQIAQTAANGAQACQQLQAQDANSYLADIRQKIDMVSSLVAGLSNMTTEESPDSNRKRCASPTDDASLERPVKALKSEPSDSSIPLAGTPSYLSPLQSPPASRPPSPGSYGYKPSSFYNSNGMTAMDITGSQSTMLGGTPLQQPPSLYRSSFSESHVPTRHAHSASSGSSTAPPLQKYVRQSPISGRTSRSGSLSNPYTSNPFEFGFTRNDSIPESSAVTSGWANNGAGSNAMTGKWDTFAAPSSSSSNSPTWPVKQESDADDNDEDDNDESNGGNHSSFLDHSSTSLASEIPTEYKAEVDRIFFEYLNRICSNLDSVDSKGEAIHQTLMAKKMQRLDESKDFRPFKFRIQAFTGAFLEELARQGYPEEKIPMKKIRNYLWRQQYILRFNEDGKKAKSKGNHIWNIEAKKTGDGNWEFRPFQRKLAGNPPSVAYCGLRWSWTPRVWDPQASWQGIPVQYTSPTLPPWLSWKGDVLSGVPPPEAEDCDVTAIAKFILDGQEGQLAHSFHLRIAPVSTIDPTFSSRQTFNLPRSKSDSTLSQVPHRAAVYPHENTRVAAVLQNVVQRVTQEVELTTTAPEITQLFKQRQVLEETLTAITKTNGGAPGALDFHSQALAQAANEVVGEAAQSATIGNPFPASNSAAITAASVNDMTNITKGAIAVAVRIAGPSSDGVHVINTAKQWLSDGRTDSHIAQQTIMPSLGQPIAVDVGMGMMSAGRGFDF